MKASKNLIKNENFVQSSAGIESAKKAIQRECRLACNSSAFSIISTGLALVAQGYHSPANIEEAIADLLVAQGLTL